MTAKAKCFVQRAGGTRLGFITAAPFDEECSMNGTLRLRRLPTVVFLLVCVALTCVQAPAFAQSDSARLSQQFMCWPIARGETATELSRRLTGSAARAWADAFQIRDPVRKMFVPKSRYRQLSTGWQACVATGPLRTTPRAYAPVVALAAEAIVPDEPRITAKPLALGFGAVPASAVESPVDVVFAAVAGGLALLMFAFSFAALKPLGASAIPPVMQRAGEEFVAAFARPLVDSSSNAPPIRTRLRFIPRKHQLEISIAPGPGRRYPNLVDHKRNLEYDVARVMRLLGAQFVVGDRLRAAGRWVVVPIRVADLNQTGLK